MMPDMPPDFAWIPAEKGDEADLLATMRAFYAEDHLVFDAQAAADAVRTLMEQPALGQIFLLKAAGAKTAATGERLRGYLVVTWGYSLEFRGRFVLLDELYLVPSMRGQGWARCGIQFVETWAREGGAAAVRLEVNHANKYAKALYGRAGFSDDRRDLMTRWL